MGGEGWKCKMKVEKCRIRWCLRIQKAAVAHSASFVFTLTFDLHHMEVCNGFLEWKVKGLRLIERFK